MESADCVGNHSLLLLQGGVNQQSRVSDGKNLVIMRTFKESDQAHCITFADAVVLIDQNFHQRAGLDFALHDAVCLPIAGEVGGFLNAFGRVGNINDFRFSLIEADFGKNCLDFLGLANQDRLHQTVIGGMGHSLQGVLVLRDGHRHAAGAGLGAEHLLQLFKILQHGIFPPFLTEYAGQKLPRPVRWRLPLRGCTGS